MYRLYFASIFLFINLVYSLDYKSNYYFGYDNNVLKYSDNENILFSRYISTQKTLSTKFKILERSTRFSFTLKKNYFIDNDEKSNYSISLKFKQPLGNYKFLDFSYNFINDIYLREYVDVDQGIVNYIYDGTECDFDFSKYSIGYETPLIRNKSKINYYYLYQTQFYNKYFTEFDLELNGFKIRYLNNNKKNKLNVSLTLFDANNISKNDETISTNYMDRGYTEFSCFLSYEYKLRGNKMGFSINENLRKYSSSIIADQLHYDRNHIDRQISLWYSFNHGDKNKSKFIMKYRERNTSSDYSWVEDLKTFDKLIFEYVIYLRKKEL